MNKSFSASLVVAVLMCGNAQANPLFDIGGKALDVIGGFSSIDGQVAVVVDSQNDADGTDSFAAQGVNIDCGSGGQSAQVAVVVSSDNIAKGGATAIQGGNVLGNASDCFPD